MEKLSHRPLEPEKSRKMSCNGPNTCELPHEESNGAKAFRYMRTCEDCPKEYPWLLPLEATESQTN